MVLKSMRRPAQIVVLQRLTIACAVLAAFGAGASEDAVAPHYPRGHEPYFEAAVAEIESRVEGKGGWKSWEKKIQEFRGVVRREYGVTLAEKRVCINGTGGFVFNRFEYRSLLYSNQYGPLTEGATRSPAYETVIHTARQLRERGIHLIFVPVPLRSEMYPEKIARAVPEGVPVSPYRTKLILDLLRAGVDAVDLYPPFRAYQEHTADDAEELFFRRDIHWSSMGIGIAAETIARRVRAYLSNVPDTGDAPPWPTRTIAWRKPRLLTAETEDGHTADHSTVWTVRQVVPDGDTPYADDPWSPVLVVGDSFSGEFSDIGAGISALLARELGMPTALRFIDAGGPHIPRLLARLSPEDLARREVVVWILYSSSVMRPAERRWTKATLRAVPDRPASRDDAND